MLLASRRWRRSLLRPANAACGRSASSCRGRACSRSPTRAFCRPRQIVLPCLETKETDAAQISRTVAKLGRQHGCTILAPLCRATVRASATLRSQRSADFAQGLPTGADAAEARHRRQRRPRPESREPRITVAEDLAGRAARPLPPHAGAAAEAEHHMRVRSCAGLALRGTRQCYRRPAARMGAS